ncbi:LemA family protein [Lysinibacillus fusiformis]|uniref:LemA family protein n=1 Tax=Lysinibacillus fusiformis TaxID=28031 RepID=UPI0000F38B33|nr:LemA family protein [Lysinibacillus fusiformis]EAZ87618.1 lemA protein [Bacillus sp. B14905]MCG7436807.1 LemA family protein [Lysinibacillus fusiformis]MED4075338.1 LemA family protein [Lysinibacillus fusiformis]NOG28966.1 LemA family protein [Lysinibacillus fusiformis]PCD81578.1 LemA family protein [Lysinibacillus fusiformis]
MKKWFGPIGIIVIILIVLALVLIPKYNSLVTAEENVDSKWAQVENQLQRRYDLIPNLVESVKGYANHEQQIIADITNARAQMGNANTPEQQAVANDALTGALSRLLVVVENYPNLKADANFRQLMDELAGTENRLAVAREDYNNEVQQFNKHVKRFPGNLMAGMFGFEQKEYFKAAAGAEQAPSIDFSQSGTQ